MRILLVLCSISLTLTACQNAPQSFASMTEEELFAYNQDKPVLNQVFCTTEATTSSYIRKRRCQTVQEAVNHNTRSAMALDVMNYGPRGSAFSRSFD